MSMLLHITAVAQCNFNEEWIRKVKVIKSVSFESLDRQKKKKYRHSTLLPDGNWFRKRIRFETLQIVYGFFHRR